MIYNNFFENHPWVWIFIILICAALIGAIAFLIHKILLRNSKEEKPSDEEIAEENLNSLLEPVEDEETKKEFEKFNNEENK